MNISGHTRSGLGVGVIAIFGMALMLATPVFAQEEASDQTQTASDPQTPVFTDRVDVNIVNLYATVVDKKGNPITGLTADDFTVIEGDQTMEITNFTAMGTARVGLAGPQSGSVAGGEAATGADVQSAPGPPSQVVVVFDNTGLEKRQRKRVLKALSPWVPKATSNGGSVLVATLEPELKVLQPFTSDPNLVLSALNEVALRPTSGDMTKSAKRTLKRSIQGTQTVSTDLEMLTQDENPSPRGGSGSSNSPGGQGGSNTTGRSNTGMSRMVSGGEVGKAQARQYLAQIETLRHQEYARLGHTLIGMDRLIRGLTGLPGRKDVLWVTEDLVMQPGIDVYRTYFTHFEAWANDLSLDQPEIWGSELELRNQFMYIAGASQIASTVLHVVDASDRDREAAATDFRSTDSASMATMSGTGAGVTAGYDLAANRYLNAGGQYLSAATGGSFFGNSRNFDGYFEDLDTLTAAHYSIGYRVPGAADGSLHPVEVRVNRPGLRVRTHERVPNPTAEQVLANMAISRLLIDEGPNPLDLVVTLGVTEPAENDRYIQEVQIQIPAANLYLTDEGGNKMGSVAVAVVASDLEGNTMPPRILQLTINLPADRLTQETVAMARLRLMMEKDTKDIAVAVRDQASGSEASVLVAASS
jgi:VWFA-related protein